MSGRGMPHAMPAVVSVTGSKVATFDNVHGETFHDIHRLPISICFTSLATAALFATMILR